MAVSPKNLRLARCVVVFAAIFHCDLTTARSITTPPYIDTEWFGLGHRECFNTTCKFGQFCSKAEELGGYCRDCNDEEFLVWCDGDDNKREFQRRMPSCYYICERQQRQLLEKQLDLERQQCNKTGSETDPRHDTFSLDSLHYAFLGIAVGLILALLVVCICIMFKRKRGQTTDKRDSIESGKSLLETPSTPSDSRSVIVNVDDASDNDSNGNPTTTPTPNNRYSDGGASSSGGAHGLPSHTCGNVHADQDWDEPFHKPFADTGAHNDQSLV